jgi:hypothetical protein
MKLGSFDVLVRALDKAGVRYLVAGGLAVAAHGYLRFTRDVDLVLQLAPKNIVSAFGALEGIGYRPLVPVTAADFADVAKRTAWIRGKGMTVLNFWCDRHRVRRSVEPDHLGRRRARAAAPLGAAFARGDRACPGRDAEPCRKAGPSKPGRRRLSLEMKTLTLSLAKRETVTRRALDAFSGKLRRNADGKIEFPFDAVHVDFMLKAA